MFGILRLGYKLLVNDRPKFVALLVGVTFAVFLMIEMTSLFSGSLYRASATVINIGAKIWVMDPAVQTVANTIPLPDYVIDEVRSIEGVKYAVPLYSGGALVKLADGTYQSVNVVGLDDETLFGRPALLQGNIEDIFAENGFFVVKDSEFPKLENPTVGTTFELNDFRGKIVGIAAVATSGLFGVPTLYTTFNRARTYIPNTRFTTSYVLVEPKDDADVARIEQAVAKMGYLALTKDEFMQRISSFYTYQTGFGINILLMAVISFIVGLSISGQTYYTFILENLGQFRRVEGDRRQEPRARRRNPVPGGIRRTNRPWARDRVLRTHHLGGEALSSDLRRHHHLQQSRARVRDGDGDRRCLQLRRHPQGPHHRSLRYFPGVSDGRSQSRD